MQKPIQVILLAIAAIIALPLLAVVFTCWLISSSALWLLVMLSWIPKGKRYLIVYSDSENWRHYFESDVLPAFSTQAKTINLSRDGGRKKWWHLDWIMYRHCAGYRNCYPIVIRFSSLGIWKSVRFYDAFIQSRKGKPELLDSRKRTIELWKEKRA